MTEVSPNRGGRELCERCKQPVPDSAAKCPACGVPILRTRRLTIYFGIALLLAIVFASVLMVKLMRDEEAQSTPTDSGEELSAPAEAPQPEKPPPLNK